MERKNQRTNLEGKRKVFFQIGLVVAMSVTVLAFEWRTPANSMALDNYEVGAEDIFEMPSNTFPKRPKAKAVTVPILSQQMVDPSKINIAPNEIAKAWSDSNEKKETETNDLENFFDFSDEGSVADITDSLPLEITERADTMPYFPGLRPFIQNNLKYPKQDQALGNEGRVGVSFVVEIDGSISNVSIKEEYADQSTFTMQREALRVIKAMPNRWIPGKQAGKRVRVRCTLPISFKLGI